MMRYPLTFMAAAAVVMLITPAVRYLALKFYIIDRKDTRKSDTRIITRFGGLAIYIGFIVSFTIALAMDSALGGSISPLVTVVMSATLMLILGAYDDIKGANAPTKLFNQVLVALILIQAGFVIKVMPSPAAGHSLVADSANLLVTILWFVGMTNAINLIDGLDGLAGGVVLINCLSLFFLFLVSGEAAPALFSIALAGSCAGFMRHNFYPAKVYMGDTGSLFLGISMGALAVLSGRHNGVSTLGSMAPAMIGLGVPLADTIFVFFRRLVINRTNPFCSDKGHLHHALLGLGLAERNAVLILWAVTIVFNIIAFIM